jgi:hypothetical protein
MIVYTVQIQEKYYYDFSVSTIKCGCFASKEAALQKAKSVYENMCDEHADDMEEYEDTTEIEEDPDTGYYSIAFGEEEDHEIHTVTVDEWEVKE